MTEEVSIRRRESGDRSAGVLYVGQAKRHKNLERLILAFIDSSYGKNGGRLTLVSGASELVADMARMKGARAVGGIRVVAPCTDEELTDLYASALVLIQPSLEEGYGLPIIEALASGIEVCCSAGGATEEAAAGQGVLFDPRSIPSMSSAIDQTVCRALGELDEDTTGPVDRAGNTTSALEFTRQIVSLLDEVSG